MVCWADEKPCSASSKLSITKKNTGSVELGVEVGEEEGGAAADAEELEEDADGVKADEDEAGA
jgi:hypothetical protein